MTTGRTVIDIDPGAEPWIRGRRRDTSPGRRPPWWLWVGAIAIVVPISLAIVALFLRVFDATDSAWTTLLSFRTVELIWRSFVLTALVTVAASVMGVGGAWLLARTDIRLRRVLGVAFALPLVIPSYVLAMVLISSSGPRGLAAQLVGVEVPLLNGLPGAWLALTLATYPYVYLITAAAIVRLDPALEEAARGLGASPWRVFRTVTLPQLRPAVGAGSLLVALYTLSDFGAVSLMRFDAFTRVIYAQYSGRIDRTPAIVLSIVLILIAGVIIWAERRTAGKGTIYASTPVRPPTRHHLRGIGRFAAEGAMGTVVFIGTIVPVGVLTTWVVRGIANRTDVSIPWNAVAGSMTGGTLAAVVAMIFTIPIVVLAVRYTSRRTILLERSVFVTFSLPHITIAIAVVAFTITWLRPIYQTMFVLVAVYAGMFIAQSTSAAKASLLQIDPAVEDASRSLGHGPFATLMRITVPLMAKGLLAGGALVFVTTLKELPVTLLLSPPGFSTLAVRVWAAADELLYTRAATAALILIAMSILPVYYLSIRPREINAGEVARR
ncbi:MAG: iron ABC transporter permease [Acidimicrobiia bacterium]